MKFENDDYVAAVAWVLQPTQPLKEQTVSSEPLINQTETGKTRCSFSPKVNCEVFLCLNVKLWSRDMSPDQKFNMKEIGELRRIYFVWINKLMFPIKGKDILLFMFGMNVLKI